MPKKTPTLEMAALELQIAMHGRIEQLHDLLARNFLFSKNNTLRARKQRIIHYLTKARQELTTATEAILEVYKLEETPMSSTTLTVTKDQLLVIWNALQQFVDNPSDEDDPTPREVQELKIAQGLVDQIDAIIAAPARPAK